LNTELIVVLDVDTPEDALRVVDSCAGCHWFKVGSQLFARCGPDIVTELIRQDRRIMLDLKFHDIPNTVHQAARAAVNMGASMFTVHATGGHDMIVAARKAVDGTETKMLAVTVLTSLNADMLRKEIGFDESPEAAVVRLAAMAIESGAHGVVCSPKEIGPVRDAIGPDMLIVTPGIRPAWSSRDDQQRLATPAEAARAGATHIVVGRPILNHDDPAQAVRLIKEELA